MKFQPGKSHQQSTVATSTPLQLTHVSCQFHGMALQEYALDAITGHVALRIGADLYHLDASDIEAAALSTQNVSPHNAQIPIQVVSDFHQQQERLIKIDMNRHLSRMDVCETDFGVTSALLTVRGQVWQRINEPFLPSELGKCDFPRENTRRTQYLCPKQSRACS
jgi:hypothetical protein